MKTKNIGGDPVKRFAGLQIDFWPKYKKGQITDDHMEAFLKLSKKERDHLVECMRKGVDPFSGRKGKKRIALKRNLNYLYVEKSGIEIPEVPEFVTHKYFKQGKNGITKIWMSENFEKTILNHAPGVISLEPTALDKLKLSRAMYDSEIMAELGNPVPYSISQVLGILKDLTGKQPKGGDGVLLSNGYVNIFYVNVGDHLVAVYAYWHSWPSKWLLHCYELGEDDRWREGNCVFSPAAA